MTLRLLFATFIIITSFVGLTVGNDDEQATSAIFNELNPQSPYYYDWLRTNNTRTTSQIYDRYNVVPVDGSNLFEVQIIDEDNGNGSNNNSAISSYLLGDLTTFIAFSDGNLIRAGIHNDAAVALLAAYHFNNLDSDLSPIVTRQDIFGSGSETEDVINNNCNIRLTLDILDTQYSPIESTRIFTQTLQRNHSIETPLPTGVVGAYRSATTSPLAILTGVNDIPQVSYASTSTDFDVKEQFPRFGRTISSSTGEARSVLDLFINLGADHVGVLFVTVSPYVWTTRVAFFICLFQLGCVCCVAVFVCSSQFVFNVSNVSCL